MNETTPIKNRKPKYNLRQNIWFMLKTAWTRKERIVIYFSLLYAAVTVGIQLTQLFITPVILQKIETMASLKDLLCTIAIFSVVLFFFNGVLGYFNRNLMFVHMNVRSLLVGDIGDKIGTTSYPNIRDPYFLKLHTEAEDACSDNDKATERIWNTLTELVINITGFIIYLCLLSHLNLGLIFLILITTTIGFLSSKQILKWEYNHREESAQIQKELSYYHTQMISMKFAKDIRIFGLIPWMQDMYAKSQKALDAFVAKRERIYVINCIIDAAMLFARNGIAYLYLIRLTLQEQLSASEFLLYFTAFTGFSTWVTGILNQMSILYKENAEISIVQEFLNFEEPFLYENGKPIPAAESYELKMEDVTFHYPGNDKAIIQHMNLTIHPGEKIAVVGLNGAGKTTLIKLLCGFYDPTEGRVLLNGTDIREFNRRKYYDMISAVFQEMSVLDITIAENVAQSVENIDLTRVDQCLAKAGLAEKIAALPRGLDTPVGRNVFLDGIEFSGGEIQRLMLARALYRDGGILVLDEPTAALDPIAENDIYMKYHEMTLAKTSIFVSHRLASTSFCDRILLLQDGKIIEEGTHASLLAKKGKYAELFEVQAKYYREGGEEDVYRF